MNPTLPRSLKKQLVTLKRRWLDGYAIKSYSQEGEDMILRRIFESQHNGFYVDVGAHHPKRFSNTYFFYKRGWRGINIDAMPGSMAPFRKFRPRDINVQCGVGLIAGTLEYHVFSNPALNTFSKSLIDERTRPPYGIKPLRTVPVDVKPLATVLEEHLQTGQAIDFLTVDVEGMDLQVLRSNDWQQHRPGYVLVEVLGSSLELIKQDPVSQFMVDVGYEIYAKCVHTVFFRRCS
jgi:FkbM family methyltransferase